MKGSIVTSSLNQETWLVISTFLAGRQIEVMNGYAERNLAHKPDLEAFIKAGTQFAPVMAFLAEHGRKWMPAQLPAGVRRGNIGMCFNNCQEIAVESEAYTYCEGYAAGIVPVLHGWLVDAAGNVIDPTWCGDSLEWHTGDIRGQRLRPPLGSEYFGVAIKTKYLIHRLVEVESYWPMLDGHAKHILSAPVDDWKHPLNRKP